MEEINLSRRVISPSVGTVIPLQWSKSQEQLALLQTCVANLHDIVLITEAEPLESPGPRILFVNKAFERITGYTAAEVIGLTPRILQGPKTDRATLDLIKNALKAQQPIKTEIYNYGKMGKGYWMEIDIVPIFDSAGTCTHFAAIQRDITESKRTSEANARLAAIVESSEDAIIGKDLNGVVTSWNRGAERTFGYTAEEMVGNPITRLIDDDRLGEEETILSRIREGKSVSPFDTVRRTKSGQLAYVSITASPIRDSTGRIIGVSKVARNISERILAAEVIADQTAYLDEAHDAIMVRDLKGHLLFWNKGAERLYGWTREEVLGRKTSELLYPHPEKFEESNRLTLSQGEWFGEIQQLTRDKRELTIDARWTVINDRAGQPKSILAINTDVTERKKIEGQFMRAQRLESIGTLAAGIAHDLNNILAPIMMSIDILKTTATDPQTKSILNTIEVSSQRGADIVKQVLSFARGLEGQRVEVHPKNLVKDVDHIIRNTFSKAISLRVQVADNSWTLLGDPTQLHQILLNLCVNARDAMPDGGALTIAVDNVVLDSQYAAMNPQAQVGSYVAITVTDTGTGISREIQNKIFDPFFTTKELGHGTGLGLSTVMAILKSHNGFVTVYSEKGRGTSFKVYLPALPPSAGTKQREEPVTLPRGNGETILVVDDENSILTITGQTLKAFGYRVLEAMDGAEAIAVYAQHRDKIAVVLTDMMMPVMDGTATIHALMRINPSVKIIAASGLNANGATAKSTPGIKHFLSKPYTAGALLQKLRTVLDEPVR